MSNTQNCRKSYSKTLPRKGIKHNNVGQIVRLNGNKTSNKKYFRRGYEKLRIHC